MADKIIIYYSRTGNTKKAAESLASKLNCETAKIVSKKAFKGILGWIYAGRTALAGKDVEIIEPDIELQNYKTIIICTPIWAGRLASPMRTWLTKNKKSCQKLAFLLSSGGGDSSGTMKSVEAITGKNNSYINISDTDRKTTGWEDKIKDFADKL